MPGTGSEQSDAVLDDAIQADAVLDMADPLWDVYAATVITRIRPETPVASRAPVGSGAPARPGLPARSGARNVSEWSDLATGSGTQLAGPEALPHLPYPLPVHVLTAWNPGGRRRDSLDNRRDNETLLALLCANGVDPEAVLGSSACRDWSEESFLISGVARPKVVEWALAFDQIGVFELTDPSLRVIRCADGLVVHETPRTHPT